MAIQIPRPQGTDPAAILAWGNNLAGTLERVLAAGQLFGSLATPVGPAGGDLSGQYPNPVVSRVGGQFPGQPSFSIYLSANQSVPNNTQTKVQLNTKEFDNGGYFDAVTNFRYTPLVAGTYFVASIINIQGTGVTNASTDIQKNGAALIHGGGLFSTASIEVIGAGLVQMNGTTDFLEVFGFITATSGNQFGGVDVWRTRFSGFRVGP